MNQERLRSLTGNFGSLTIAVVGDFCLDRYLEIDPARAEVSIETGLPVHNVVRVRAQPGAAGTVLNNLVALGVGRILPVGWCGDDGEGYELRRSLAAIPSVDLTHFVTAPNRRTFTYCKPLVVEPGKPPRELNRLDSKNWTATPQAVERQTVDSLEQLGPCVDAMILLDQVDLAETGVITAGVLNQVDQLAARQPCLRILGDSRRGLTGWPAITFKMNAAELARLVGTSQTLNLDLVRGHAVSLARARGKDVFVTLAEQGLLAALPSGQVVHQPALPVRGELDIVGAGDSVTANLTAALAAQSTVEEALTLAALASSIVIHKLGTTGTASPQELEALLANGP